MKNYSSTIKSNFCGTIFVLQVVILMKSQKELTIERQKRVLLKLIFSRVFIEVSFVDVENIHQRHKMFTVNNLCESLDNAKTTKEKKNWFRFLVQ
jgi:hypothetical protein